MDIIDEKTKSELLYTHDQLIVGRPSEIIYCGDSILALSIGQYDHLVSAIETMKPLNFRYQNSLYALIDIHFNVIEYNKGKIQEKCESFESGKFDLDLGIYIIDGIVPNDEMMRFIVLVMGNIDILA